MAYKSQKNILVGMALLLFLAVVVPCSATTVDIRGEAIDTGAIDAGNISWDYSNFPGLYFAANKYTQLSAGAGEHLYFENDDDGGSLSLGSANPNANVIDEGELIYTTKQVASKYKVYSEVSNITRVTKFYTLSLFGTMYCAVDNDATKLAKILMQQSDNDKKTMKSGEEWSMKNGYSLVMNAVDVDGSKCYMTLYKNGEVLDTGVVSTDGSNDDKIYFVEDECSDGSDHIYFLTYVDSIFAGKEDNFAVLKYTWLSDKDSYMEVSSGDEFGNFEVDEAFASGLKLSNSNSISINVNAGTATPITGDLYFKASDEGKGSNGGYVFYPVKVLTVEDSSSMTVSKAEDTAVNESSSDSDEVVVDMSSDSNDGSDISGNTNSASENDNGSSAIETKAVENSVPGFELPLAVISISLVFLLRRTTLK
ncbi:S-layer protein domain-containing protein [Methanolobus sediminis]|uniref:S-layer protein domain-containing protein n=1 Tax=Methanolobus sediminis TaxID=3072978 RepID=A0AA51UIY0_9EURY|nr:S-layer protein domain-containing protein [Methanolobus sediminis]WMW24396.1 S-layer protein domain-containing protein [Methanolobus sediminis]